MLDNVFENLTTAELCVASVVLLIVVYLVGLR